MIIGSHSEFSMTIRSRYRYKECTKEENKSQTLDLSVKTDRHYIHKKEQGIYMEDEASIQNPESMRIFHLQEGHMASN
jgi:hypothetical protein